MSTDIQFFLHETAIGYALFKVNPPSGAIGLKLKEVASTTDDLSKFGKLVKLVSFQPFKDITESFENAISITEGSVPDTLKNFLELNLPKSGKNAKVKLGIAEKILAGSIRAIFPSLEFETADTNNAVQEVLRGIRAHQDSLIDNVNAGDIEKAGLSLGHLYSRSAVKYNAARNDRSVMNCLLSLETQDKSLNSYLMRLKEWYGWYFPELRNICDDNLAYANLIVLIAEKRDLGETDIERIAELVDHDIEKATAIVEAARISMGLDLPDRDLFMIKKFAEIVCRFNKVRNTFSSSLEETMKAVAPNLQVLVGTIIGARLIEKAGSLVKLAKEPASTLQILGAEKALFRALKTKSNTPKYGILFHSSFVGRAVSKDKGRIARYLANKCVVAARIDAFSENPGTQYGEALRQQVEDRLEFYATGKKTATNQEVMDRATALIEAMGGGDEDDDMPDAVPEPSSAKKEKKDKKDKKDKKEKKDKEKKRKRDEDAATPKKADGEGKKKKKSKSAEIEV